MASTIANYQGNGSTTDFSVPFDYLAKKFVKVTVDSREKLGGDYGDTTKDYFFVDKTTIRFNTAPASGTEIIIRRYTSATDRIVSFKDASVLKAKDLDASAIQTIHIAEEGRDIINDALIVDKESNWDARGHRIVNVGDPIGDNDAVSFKFYKDDAMGAYQAKLDAEAARDAAKVSETNSKASEVNSKESEVTAKASAGTAVSAAKHADAVKVENQAILQEAKEIRDENKVLDTNTKNNANVAQVKANEAKVSETSAKKSEVNSKASEVNAKDSEGKASNSAELAKQWATKLGATVDDNEYSAKYYANKANEVLTQVATDVVNRVTAEGTKQVGLVSNQGTISVNAVKTQQTTSVNAVTAEGTKQVDLVSTEGTNKVDLAKAQATIASQGASTATAKATIATQQATIATTKASEAEDSATNAANSAGTATTQANVASNSAKEAKLSADNAALSKTAAGTSEVNARASEVEAKKQADLAKQYADQAVAGQIQADWAQTNSTKNDFIKNKPTLGTLSAKNSLAYSELTGVPSSFTPSSHTHPISQITNLQASLDAKTNDATLQVDLTAIRESITNVSAKVDGIGDTLSPTYAKKQGILDACDKALNGANPIHAGDPTLDEIKSALATIQAQLGQLESRRYVKETGKSSDGSSWYRKWSDGFIEQGGKIPHGNAWTWYTATLNIPFTTTSYTLVVGVYVTDDSSAAGQENNNYLLGKKSANSFRYRQLGNVNNPTADWYACGY